jgi:glutamine cyclotransferase
MTIRNPLFFFFLTLFVSACGNKYKLELQAPKTIQVNKALSLKVVDKNRNPIDSVQFFLNGKRVVPENLTIANEKLGKQAITANVFYDGKTKLLTNTIYFLAANPPVIYNYEVINEYPHDATAFTQGLEIHNEFFYESTGNYGKSSLRKVKMQTGEILQRVNLDKKYFAEGITILNNKIYQLTWKEEIGFVYDLETMKVIDTFRYGQSREGWGLTHNDKFLIKSDGTESIWSLDTGNLKEVTKIEAYTDKRKAEKLNELEFIKGKIYANIWQQNAILIIDPVTGAIEGIANLKGLQDKVGQQGDDNVLNGIAYDQAADRLFVTGKNWKKVYEIKLTEK